jgi:hypothetical protein
VDSIRLINKFLKQGTNITRQNLIRTVQKMKKFKPKLSKLKQKAVLLNRELI